MSSEFFDILGNISSFIVIFPLIVSIFKYRSLNKIQILLMYLLIAILIIEFISNILWYKQMNNMPLYHFYSIIEFLLIVVIYKNALGSLFSNRFFISISIGYVLFAILNIIFFQGLFTFNSNTTTLTGVVVILFSLCYFYTLLKEVKYSALETNPMFWINSGFLIYFSSNLMLFFMNNNLFKDVIRTGYALWGLHAFINIVLTLFYTLAIWVNPKKL